MGKSCVQIIFPPLVSEHPYFSPSPCCMPPVPPLEPPQLLGGFDEPLSSLFRVSTRPPPGLCQTSAEPPLSRCRASTRPLPDCRRASDKPSPSCCRASTTPPLGLRRTSTNPLPLGCCCHYCPHKLLLLLTADMFMFVLQ